jgi:PAS domain S-box-containing protein
VANRFDPTSKTSIFLNWLVISAIVVLVLASGGLFTWIEARAARKVMQSTMMAQALMLSASFDIDKIASLTGTSADLTSSNYHYLRNKLIRIRNTNPKYRYLYFFGRRDGKPPFFFMGTAPEDTEDYSPPGQLYFEESPTLNQVFQTLKPGISPPFTDRWGTWVSALVPVIDPQTGALLAVFGMDVDAHDFEKEILRRSMMPAMITCLIILVMGAGTGYLRRRQLAGHIVALQQAQEALSESEALFRLQFELTNIGIAISSPEKGWLRANAHLCEMLGYAESELRQKTWDEMTHPDDLAEDLDCFRQMVAGRKERYEMDKRFFRKDGSIVDTHLTVSCHRDPNGAVKFVIASIQNISDRKKAEIALRESERKYRLIAENAVDIIFTMDMDFHYTYISPSVQKVRGFTPKEAMAQSFEQIMTPESLQRAYQAIESANTFIQKGDFGQRLTLELEQFRKDGSTFWTENEISFIIDDGGKAIGIIGVTRDVTGRKTAEHSLQESQGRFRSMIQSASDMIFIIDTDGKIAYESPSVARILGYREDYFLGQSPFTLIHRDDMEVVTKQMDLVYKSANSGIPTEFRLKKPDDSWIWLEALANNQYANPSIRGIVITARDITERKRSELEKDRLNAQLLQAQKMEAVGHLAGGIAHDFNNMLSVVIGHTEMALINLDPGNAMHSCLNSIHEAARRSADLVRQLLAFARRQTISPKVLDVNDTISGMLTMLRRLIGEDIDLTWTPGQCLGKIRIDPSQLDQILANLMVNARDAIAGVGKVTIETEIVALDEAYCASHPGFLPGRYVMLSISDSGCGMDKKTLAQIFDPFFTTKSVGTGTGLGLAMVYGIIKQNDGFINVYSEPNRGTTFRIYLPVVDAVEDIAEAGIKTEPVSGGTGTVLIVEDDAAILEIGQSILEKLGYTVIAADTPDRAIEIAREMKGKIDLLITDVVMPQMSGRDLVQHLVKITPGLKCLYMSGYTANVIAHRGVLEPGVHFLQKPFTIRDIATKVREVIG